MVNVKHESIVLGGYLLQYIILYENCHVLCNRVKCKTFMISNRSYAYPPDVMSLKIHTKVTRIIMVDMDKDSKVQLFIINIYKI